MNEHWGVYRVADRLHQDVHKIMTEWDLLTFLEAQTYLDIQDDAQYLAQKRAQEKAKVRKR